MKVKYFSLPLLSIAACLHEGGGGAELTQSGQRCNGGTETDFRIYLTGVPGDNAHCSYSIMQ